MKKAVILTYHIVKNSYSCLFYLKQALDKNFQTSIWGLTKKEQMNSSFRDHYNAFLDMPYGIIPKLRAYIAKIHAFVIGMKNDVIIFNDFEFYIVIYCLKKLFPKKKVVFYCTEIPDENTPCPSYLLKFYKKQINFPDLVIDCLRERAEYRKREYGLRNDYYVIDNTIPRYVISELIDSNYNPSKYLDFVNSNPIVIYAGGCNMSRGLEQIVSAIPYFADELNFVFFCHGEDAQINILRNKCKKFKNCRVYNSVDRKTLLNVMQYCNIGIQYYDPAFSINTKYASPSKFYEYLALGLCVLSSDNIGINKMINDDQLGVCIENKQTVADGIRKIIECNMLDKKRIQQLFTDKYCYEINSKEAVKKILEWR